MSNAAKVNLVPPHTVNAWVKAGEAVVIDVREADEYAAGRIAGATNLPLSTIELDQIPAIPEGKKLVLHCRSGVRCGMAATKLVAAGYAGEINRMEGGIMAWADFGFPVEG